MLILSQVRIVSSPLSQVGAKAATLGRLARTGLPVPKFFVIASEALALHLSANQLRWPHDDPDRAPALREAILRAPVPAAVSEQVLQAFDGLAAGAVAAHVAVRSSAAEEDGATASFAGQFSSVLGVDRAGLLGAVQQCWADSLSERSLAYRASRRMPLGAEPSFGLMVQAQVFPHKAGVLFTRHPLDPAGERAYLEANYGTGESVVGGMVTPDAVTFSRANGSLQVKVGSKQRMTTVAPGGAGSTVVEVEPAAQQQAVLTEAEAQALFVLGLRVEAMLGGPQDIEWALDERGPWLLQSRPMTAASGRGE